MEANGKIPLTLGFADFSDDDFVVLIDEDSTTLSRLFEHVRVGAPAHNIPSAKILFVYTHLNENGTIRGSDGSGIRQIVQLTKSAVVVVASPNSAANIKNAAGIPGPKTANIGFTADRNGQAFATFFHALFDKMRNGENMPSAWVELAPQGPIPTDPNLPVVVLLAEAGKIAFPKPS